MKEKATEEVIISNYSTPMPPDPLENGTRTVTVGELKREIADVPDDTPVVIRIFMDDQNDVTVNSDGSVEVKLDSYVDCVWEPDDVDCMDTQLHSDQPCAYVLVGVNNPYFPPTN